MGIDLNSVSCHLGGKEVFRDLSLAIPTDSLTALIGPSGSGKSVLLKMLAGVYPISGGSIDGLEVESDKSTEREKRTIGMLFGEGALFDSMSVLDNVALPLIEASGSRINKRDAEQRAFNILEEVGLGRDFHKLPGQLSGGMRRRVALARAIVGEPDIALLDEPTGGLDPVTSNIIIQLILKLQEQIGTQLVVVSHDLRRLLPVAKFTVCLIAGKAGYVGKTDHIAEASEDVRNFVSKRYDL